VTPDERRAAGKRLREKVPREAHGDWHPHPERTDPWHLHAAGATPQPALVPLRYGRMLRSPFTFYRGSGAVRANAIAARLVDLVFSRALDRRNHVGQPMVVLHQFDYAQELFAGSVAIAPNESAQQVAECFGNARVVEDLRALDGTVKDFRCANIRRNTKRIAHQKRDGVAALRSGAT